MGFLEYCCRVYIIFHMQTDHTSWFNSRCNHILVMNTCNFSDTCSESFSILPLLQLSLYSVLLFVLCNINVFVTFMFGIR